MTSLGLDTAAVSEAAALFPLAAAAPAAADDSAGAASSFDDLLAASFGETPIEAGGDEAPAPKGVSMADTWFATLNVDFTGLNASLEAQETAAPSITIPDQTASPVDDADADKCAADVDDEDAGALLMALTVPAPVPVPLSEPLPAAASAPSDAPTTSLSGFTSVPCEATTAEAHGSGSNVERLTPPLNIGKASAEEVGHDTAPSQPKPVPAVGAATTAEVKAAANSLDVSVGGELPTPDDASSVTAPVAGAPAVRPNAPRGAVVARAPERQPDAAVSDVVAATPQAPVAEPQQQQGPTIDVAPANGRTREAAAARVAELSGFGQGGGSGSTAAAIASQAGDSQSQSHTQDGSPNEALALGVQENTVASRPADGSPAPVFTLAQPAASAAAQAVTHAPDVSQAQTFTSVPDPQNVGRMIESMRVQIKEGIQEATVHLKPEHLGEVTISVRIERGAVSAIVHTDTPAVQQWLEAQEGKLRSGLSDQGLHLERFYVHRDGSQERREQPRQQNQTAQRYRQQRDGSAVRFEVLV